MQILKASPYSRILHLPSESLVDSKTLRVPLCQVSAEPPHEEFGILEDGTPTCIQCIEIATEMVKSGMIHVQEIEGDIPEYRKAVKQVEHLREHRFHGIERVYIEKVYGG